MCGIIGFIPKNNKNTNTGKLVIEQYQRQLQRGQRGFGLMSIFPNKVIIDRATEPSKIIIDTYLSQAPIKFFHHRQPTSTENEMEQTHPFLIEHDELKYSYYLLHNGVIRNAEELKKQHTEELGYLYKTYRPLSSGYTAYSAYKTFNDSEALAIEAARYFDGQSEKINALGTIAFILVRMEKKTHKPIEVIWSRNGGNPLEMVETKEGLLIASEVYHEDAELVPEFTFEVIDLKKYFNAKKEVKSIIKLIKAGEADYAVPPPPPPPAPITTYNPNTQRSMGFGTHSIPQKTETSKKTSDDSFVVPEDKAPELTLRERAFMKMAERVILDISDDIYDFFENLAYNDMTDDEIMSVANSLNDLLIEKVEISKERVRPHFDTMDEKADEKENIDPLFDDEPAAHAVEDEEDYASTTNFSLNERMDASRKRFDEIMD